MLVLCRMVICVGVKEKVLDARVHWPRIARRTPVLAASGALIPHTSAPRDLGHASWLVTAILQVGLELPSSRAAIDFF